MTFIGGAQYSYEWDKCLFMPATFTGGAEYSYDDLRDEMLGYNRTIAQTVHIGSAFAQNEWKNDRWSFLIGGRLDKHNMMDHVIFSPRANVRFNPTKDINLYINSPGGSVTAGMAIYDTMNYIKCDVSTVCMGMAASMGAFLLAGGAKGKRFALPNAEVMIHQPSGGAQGQATEIRIVAEQILRTKKKLNEILAANTGQPLEVIERDTERDNYMTAEEAVKYGLIDAVISKH